MHSIWDLLGHTCFSSSHLSRKPPIWRVLKPSNLHITLALATLTVRPVHRTPKPANTSASDVRPGHLCRERPRTPWLLPFQLQVSSADILCVESAGTTWTVPISVTAVLPVHLCGKHNETPDLAPPQYQQPCQGDLYQRALDHPSLCSLQLKPSCPGTVFQIDHPKTAAPEQSALRPLAHTREATASQSDTRTMQSMHIPSTLEDVTDLPHSKKQT